MKEASGELSMTVIVIVAAVLIVTFLTVILWPRIRNYISQQWDQIENA